jgi:tetratricopeptide (TPR) repeat protein
MMKIGRNQPCPCGSGEKYKRCCLSKDQASRLEAASAAQQHAPTALSPPPGFFFGEDELDKLSNSVVRLINDGRLDEAEVACQELKAQYPEVIDWIMRTAMLHEARGETHQAIAHYEQTLQYMDDNPEDFEEQSREPFRADIERLKQTLDTPS